jgi:YggT family protein
VITIIYTILEEVLSLYRWVVIIAAVFSTLVSFGVLDTRNRIVWSIGDFLYRVTEPALRPIRNVLPSFGSIDISPIVLILLIWVAQEVLRRVYFAIQLGDVQGLLF